MQTKDATQKTSIIADIYRPYRDYPYRSITGDAAEALRNTAAHLPKSYGNNTIGPVIRALECYLQLKGDVLTLDCLQSDRCESIALELLGAIYSTRFIKLSLTTRSVYARTWIRMVQALHSKRLQASSIPLSSVMVTESVSALVDRFESLQLLPDAEYLWRAWPTKNLHGKLYWLPLRSIYERLGRDFTDVLYNALDTWYSGRRADKIPVINELAEFISSHPTISPEMLKNRKFMTNFWHDFWEFYREERKKSCNNSTLATDWAHHWVSLATEVLTSPSLFAPHYGAFPGPDNTDNSSSPKNTSSAQFTKLDGLLIDFPVESADSDALEFLCQAIPRSVQIAVTWAEAEVKGLIHRHRRRKALARTGSVRTVGLTGVNSGGGALTKRSNASYLNNAAATYEFHGHQTCKEVPSIQVLYPTGLRTTAFELGLPTSTALLPFATLLVAEHPAITPSFLEHLELFNKHDKLSGLRKLDSGWYLIGYKYRRGKRLGQQRVKLTSRTLRVVLKLIAVTRSLREYLKRDGDSSWRKLFLSCSGFGRPLALKKFASLCCREERIKELTAEFSRHCGLCHESAARYAQRFSLRTLRFTKGIAVFIETKSESAMAKALGHETAQTSLLSRYLPAEFLAFFRNRWIRAFQLRLVIEATRGTPHLMRATGLKSREQLDTFLRNNAFPNITKLSDAIRSEEEQSGPTHDGTFVFKASKENLTVLVSLSEAVKRATGPVSATAAFWSQLGDHVVAYIDKQKDMQPAIAEALQAAKQNADMDSMEAVLYG